MQRTDYVAREKGDEWNAGNRVTSRKSHCIAEDDCTERRSFTRNFFSRTADNKTEGKILDDSLERLQTYYITDIVSNQDTKAFVYLIKN